MSFVYGILFGGLMGLVLGVVFTVWLFNTPVNKDVIDEYYRTQGDGTGGEGPF